MRSAVFVSCTLFVGFLLAVVQPVAADATGPSVIQFGYSWGTTKIGGAQVWTSAFTNLTMNTKVFEQNGTQVEEITEFRVHAVAPGTDPYPPTNGTNQFPWPQIGAAYETLQVIRDPNNCVPSNNSVGLICGVPTGRWEHQVLETRFLRLIEFTDSNGDGGYTSGEPVVSQLDLADRAFRYAAVSLEGLNATRGLQALPFRIHYPDVCCGEGWEGWIGRNETPFADFDGLAFRISATGPANLTISGYQWFRPRIFQGANLTPLQAKLDLSIEDYPFVSTSSRLALELKFTSFSQGSSTNWEVLPWPQGQALGADSTNTTAIFAWSSSATADGVPTSVIGTVVPVDALSREVFLSYPRASVIEHDPVLGITDKRVSTEHGIVPNPFVLSAVAIAFVTTLAVASLAIYVTERRKR